MNRKNGMNKIIGFLLILLLSAPLVVIGGEKNGQQPYRADELVCKMYQGYSIGVVLDSFSTTLKGLQPQTGCYLLGIPEGADPESLGTVIEQLPEVQFCRANYILGAPEPFQRSQPFIDVQAVGDMELQPAAQTLAIEQAISISDGSGVRVAIIDAGIDFSHPFFADCPGTVTSGYDYVDNDSDAFDEPGGPATGHGTFIAGIYHLTAPGADLISYRVLDTLGSGDGYTIAEAILQAMDDECKVINLSLGMIGTNDAVDEALKLAKRNNIMVVAAAGNDSTDNNLIFPFPAERTYCMAVAALDSLLVKADFSNYGIKIDVCAPGTQIYGPYPGEQYAWWDGTSFAAPFAGALAALLYSADPSATWDEVFAAIELSAINVDSLNPGLEGQLGSGLIDLEGALTMIQEIVPLSVDCNGNLIDDGIDLAKGILEDTNGDGFPDNCTGFICGDLDGDQIVNILDILFYIQYKFKSGAEPSVLGAADVNHDLSLNIIDIVYLIDFKFMDGPAPDCAWQ